MNEEQLSLFNLRPSFRVEQPKKVMSEDDLLKWKSTIFKHQQQTLQTEPPQQTSLFDVPTNHCASDAINPFELKLHSSEFYRLKEIGDRVNRLARFDLK